MISHYFNLVLYEPLYNGMVLLINYIPGGDVGIAIVIFTVLIKFVMFPLSKKSLEAQVKVKELEPKIKEIKKNYADNKQLQAQKTMELYRENKINPLSGFLLVLIQLPIIFALYFIFLRGGLPAIDSTLLYSFVPTPEHVNTVFLGLIDLSKKSIVLALAAGASQFYQIRFSIPQMEKRNENATFKDDLARSMNLQMRYVMPVIITVFAYSLSAFVALYWTTSNLFAIIQEIMVRRSGLKHKWHKGHRELSDDLKK